MLLKIMFNKNSKTGLFGKFLKENDFSFHKAMLVKQNNVRL